MIHPIAVIRRGEHSFVRERLKEEALLPVEAFALQLIATMDGCNQDALSVRLEVDKGRVAKLLARLERQGHIQRTVNQCNKREKKVQITDRGRQVLQRVSETFEEWNELCLEGFSEQERTQYFSYIHRIAENVARNRKDSWS